MRIVSGYLGWGNRKTGCEAYGPGGRWMRRHGGDKVDPPNGTDGTQGDLLGDALERAGFTEGATLLVVAINRGPDHDDQVEVTRARLIDALDLDITEP